MTKLKINNVKHIILTVKEYNHFRKICPPFWIDYAHYNNPNFGFNGSGRNYVVYLTAEMTLSVLFSLLFNNSKN